MNYHITHATNVHYPAICELIAQLADEENCTSYLTTDNLHRQIMEAAPPLTCLVALDTNNVIGCVIAYIGFDVQSATRGWHLSDIIVAPEQRERGIGKALLAVLAKEGLAHGLEWMSWTVMRDNHTAKAFYHKIDAEHINVDFMAIGKTGLRHLAS